MAILSVCVDRARIMRKEPSVERVEGTTTFEVVPEQWFKCRLFLTSTTDIPDAAQSHWLSTSAPQVLCGIRDCDGERIVLRSDQHLDIKSRQLGRALWRADGEPQPLRKKHRVIGYVLIVSRVIEWPYDDLFAQNMPDIYQPVP